jgi:hypothetical protein
MGRGWGPCAVDVVEEQGSYTLGDSAAKALEPFFAEIFDKCGKKRS